MLIPFGLGSVKPKHFRDMLKVAWRNRDNSGYAWKVLSQGVCDGCALGVSGFHDWTLDGVHLCMTRLNLLRLNTMPAMHVEKLADVSALEGMDNAALRELGRLPYPMLREKGQPGFRRITWTDALERVARRVRVADPRRIGFFLTSRGITNEVYYVAQKVARFLGTNNVDNAARLCHSPSTGAMKYALGVAATTCSYRDWYGTDLIVFFGANPANDQPVTTKFLHEARRRGTRVAMVNPYLEPGMKRYWVPSTAGSAVFGSFLTDYWFPVTQGGDIAFLYGVIKVLLKNGWQDQAWIDRHTQGFEALCRQVDAMDWATLERQSGLDWRSMEEFADLIHEARNAVLVWSMGITQHAFGGDAVSMILNLGLMRGYVGREKNGLMPIRGHSGVQGGAEMGAYATAFPGGLPITAENARALEDHYGFPIPSEPGLASVDMIEAAARGEMEVLYSLGGNFLRNLPDPDHVRQALANVPLRVHQDIIVTDQMLVEPGEEVLLLPAKTRYEQDGGGTETTTERRILFSPELPRPEGNLGEAKAEWRILLELARVVRPVQSLQLGCASGEAIRKEIAKVVPIYDGIQHLKRSGDAVQYGGPHLCAQGVFPTPGGRARFRPVPLPDNEPDRSSAEQDAPGTKWFKVSTRRGKQFNSLIYDDVDPLTGAARDAVFMNPEDAALLHLKQGDALTLSSQHGHFEGRLFPAPIARGNLQVHWPEGNILIPSGVLETLGGVPDYNAWVRVKRRAD